MCGFVGYIHQELNRSPEGSVEQLLRMADAMTSRGPDSSGHWVDNKTGVGLAHRRLAILDLSDAGHQPMVSSTGRYVISYNGEIYNHLRLRDELSEYEWRGHSDTETLLACIEELGLEATLRKASGMFAFALWDRDAEELSLARDRFGEKPVYYGWQGGSFLFGSDLSALKVFSSFEAQIDRSSLAAFLRYSYVPTPLSIYKDIFKLIPGTILTLTKSGAMFEKGFTPKPVPFWSFDEMVYSAQSQPFAKDEDIAVNEVDKLISDAVGRQMISDVPIGVFLSGGIDSSAIAAVMQAQSDVPINTFSIGFHEAAYNEAEDARAIAEYLGTNHHEWYVTAEDALNVIPNLHRIYSEPFADSSQIPTYLVAKLAKKSVTVSLSGDGGDEIFGGYNRHSFAEQHWPVVNKIPIVVRRRLIRPLHELICSSATLRRMITFIGSHFKINQAFEKLTKISEVSSKETFDAAYVALSSICKNPSEVLNINGPRSEVTPWSQRTSSLTCGHDFMYRDTLSYLPDDILVKVDRAAMASSLETRVPFLDNSLVEFVWRLPIHFKIRKGEKKWILRQVLYKYIPRHLVDRPKRGFAVPIDSWLRGPLKKWADSLLEEERLTQEGYFNVRQVRKMFEEHVSGKRDWQHQLWNILIFQSWLDHNGEKK